MNVDVGFLEPFVVDPEILTWHPGSQATDLAKKTIDLMGQSQ